MLHAASEIVEAANQLEEDEPQRRTLFGRAFRRSVSQPEVPPEFIAASGLFRRPGSRAERWSMPAKARACW